METTSSSASTPSSSSSHISLSYSLSLPRSCQKHVASKIENLVEYSYIPESAQINESQFPIMSPYNLYKQKTSLTRSVRTLISTKRPLPKEYIQSSRLDQCALQASPSEQYVTLEIPSDLVANWKREGYTHLHLGGIRLILTLHGRKGLPVIAKIALLDTRFKQYQHAVIGTVLTTLPAGSVLLTFYLNFNLSLEDLNLLTTIKVHIQLQGAKQTPTSKLTTLHHQIVYQLQNHALDLPTPSTTSAALMILADTDTIPTIIQIPKQIQKQELLKLMPLEWLTNYEHFHQNYEPVQTTEATFERRQNGQVKLSFQTIEPQLVPETPRLSYTAMIATVQTGQEKTLPIHGFSSEVYPVYPDKLNGHFLWDVPKAHMCNLDCPCLDDMDIDNELEVMRRKNKKKKKPSHSKTSCKSFPPQSPPDPKPPVQPIRSCLMFSDANLRRMINNHIWGPEFNKKEEEIRKLKAELARIDAERTRPTLFTQTQSTPMAPPVFETYSLFYTSPKPPQPVYNQLFEPTSKPTPSSSVPPVPPEDSPKVTPEPPKKDKGPMDQYHYHIVHDSSPESSKPETVCESNPSESNSSSSSPNSTNPSTNSESEYADITSILMETKPDDPDCLLDFKNLLHGLISKEQSQMFNLKLSFVNSWPDLRVLYEIEQDDQIAFIIAESFDSEDISVISTIQNVNHVSTIPRPSLKMSILPSKFHKPVPIIEFIDTGADTSMIDPFVLPSDYWEPHSKLFRAVNGETFETTLITKKPIGKNLFLTSSGVRYKQMFLPYTDKLRLYALSETPSPYSHISHKFLEFCPENHSQFHHPSPLWKNEQFFIHLPFKLNEDLNPTKASHPESAQINESQFPIMSPYNLYKQKTSLTRSIRTLISTKRPLPKEYIQSSRLDQCSLQASQSEQYVTMEIPSYLVTNWKREGYTHLHLGGVRLILTLHGRKGLPVTARIALLDTRFKEYQHAVVGTVLTTLYAGSVLLTFYPNFNLSLEDPNLPTTLKVQIQLQGAEQTPTSKIATLHHQIVYRLQNHALDLPTPYTTSDALMILADTDTIPTIIQIPKQIQKQDLLKLMPFEWLTNYEHFHQNSEPVQTTEATFDRRPNGPVKLSFQTLDTKPVPDSPQLSYTAMITAVQTGHMCNPDCPCLDDMDIGEELEVMRRKTKKKKKASYPPSSYKSFAPQPPLNPKPPVQPIRSCLMIDAEKTRPFLFTQPQPTLVSPLIFETYAPFYPPSRSQQPVYNQFFGFSHLQPTPQPSSPKKSRSKVKISEPRPKATSSSSTSTIPLEESPQDHPEPLKKDKGPMDQYHYHTVHIQSSDSSDSSEPETHNSSSSSSYDSSNASTDSESEYADITGILMATETADPSAYTPTPIVDDNPSDQASQTDPVPPPVHEHSTKPFF
ncbi:hypothetical protein KPL70_023307 [Citrus sinensis]|nr:hypothetical protein KPL70_023307 [Citrus sinensis]